MTSHLRDEIYSTSGKSLEFLKACCGKNLHSIKIPTPDQQLPHAMIRWCEEHAVDHYRFEWHGVNRMMMYDGRQRFVDMYALFFFKDKSDLIRFKLSN